MDPTDVYAAKLFRSLHEKGGNGSLSVLGQECPKPAGVACKMGTVLRRYPGLFRHEPSTDTVRVVRQGNHAFGNPGLRSLFVLLFKLDVQYRGKPWPADATKLANVLVSNPLFAGCCAGGDVAGLLTNLKSQGYARVASNGRITWRTHRVLDAVLRAPKDLRQTPSPPSSSRRVSLEPRDDNASRGKPTRSSESRSSSSSSSSLRRVSLESASASGSFSSAAASILGPRKRDRPSSPVVVVSPLPNDHNDEHDHNDDEHDHNNSRKRRKREDGSASRSVFPEEEDEPDHDDDERETAFLLPDGTVCYPIGTAGLLRRAVQSGRIVPAAGKFCAVLVGPGGLLSLAHSKTVCLVDTKAIGQGGVLEMLQPQLGSHETLKVVYGLRDPEQAALLEGSGMESVLDFQLWHEFKTGDPSASLETCLAGLQLWSPPLGKGPLAAAAQQCRLLDRAVETGRLDDPSELERLLAASADRFASCSDGAAAFGFDPRHGYRLASAELLRAGGEAIRGRPVGADPFVEEDLLAALVPDLLRKLDRAPEEDEERAPRTEEAPRTQEEENNTSPTPASPVRSEGSLSASSTGAPEEEEQETPASPSHDKNSNHGGDEQEQQQEKEAETEATAEETRTLLPVAELTDVVMDLGRRPECWIGGRREFLSDDPTRLVRREDLDRTEAVLGAPGRLHRCAALRDQHQNLAGLTIRLGRNLPGAAEMLLDVLVGTDKSVLILGEPGSGRTTLLRDAARILAETKNVLVVDTTNEIAGDGVVPHPGIGLARRAMVPSPEEQAGVMVEGCRKHSPHAMVLDEIGGGEVAAAKTVRQRGCRMIAAAHGDLRGLVRNPELAGLVGGVEHTVPTGSAPCEGDDEDRTPHGSAGPASPSGSETKGQRRGEPIFDVIVEVRRGAFHEWRVVADTATAVDRILAGLPYEAQFRTRDPETGTMRMKPFDA